MQIQSSSLLFKYSTPFLKNDANAENSPSVSSKSCACDNSKLAEKKQATATQLTEEQQREVEELKKRDQEVRAHELAHLAAAGAHAGGGISFEYRQGPDGKRYAVGGEVSIDTSAVANDPEATLRKARQIQAAAYAPAEPSGQDRAVGQQAAQMAAQAQQEILELKSAQTDTGKPNTQSEGNIRLRSYTQTADAIHMGQLIDQHV